MNPIHFSSLFGVDYDLDLIHPWAQHYSNAGLDTYRIFLHSGNNDTRNLNEAYSIFIAYGFDVQIVTGKFRIGNLRSETIGEYAAGLPKNDFLVTADSEEIQNVDYQKLFTEYDIICGRLIDRYDHTLHAANSHDPLEKQFPLSGDVESLIYKSTNEHIRKRFAKVRKDKIIGCRAGYNVNYGGSHMLMETPANAKFTDQYPVLHYTWRESIIERMADRGYYTPDQIWETKRFFNNAVIDETFQKVIDKSEKEQMEKGWVIA